MGEKRAHTPRKAVISDGLRMRVFAAEHPELRSVMESLKGNNLTLRRQRVVDRTLLREMNDVVEEASGLRRRVVDAVVSGKEIHGVEGEQLARVRSQVDTMIQFTADGELTQEQQHALAILNTTLAPDRDRYAQEMLRTARPDGEKLATAITVAAGTAAAVGSSYLNIKGESGWALALGGQSDDFANSAAVTLSEIWHSFRKDWKGSLKKAVMDNRLTVASISVATLMDWKLVPVVLSMGGVPALAIGSGLFWFTAVAGSLASEYSNYRRSKKTIKELDSAGHLYGKVSLADTIGGVAKPEELHAFRQQQEFQHALRRKPSRRERNQSLTDLVRDQLKQSHNISNADAIIQYVAKLEATYGKVSARDALKLVQGRDLRKMARKETFANPFRRWLGLGIGISLAGSMAFGLKGLLIGHGIQSGLVDAGIGPVETVTAMVGSTIENKVRAGARNVELVGRYVKAKLGFRPKHIALA